MKGNVKFSQRGIELAPCSVVDKRADHNPTADEITKKKITKFITEESDVIHFA